MKLKSNRKLQLALALGFLVLGVFVMMALTMAKKPLDKRQQIEHKPLVLAKIFKTGKIQTVVEGQGAVSPLNQGTLSAEVAGTVISVSNQLVAGGTFKQGQELIKIDPADYKLDVILRKADVEMAEKNLQLAKEEVVVAKEEWSRLNLGKGGGDAPPPLVAKEPHLEAAAAALEAANASLGKANLFLKRTSLKAPFDGRVVSKHVDLGQYVVKGQAVAKVYSTEVAEITVNLSDKDLAWIKVPGLTSKTGPGSMAEVSSTFGGKEMKWSGQVVRSAGEFDPRTRLVPVVVQVQRPYDTIPPLTVGMYVKVNILGRDIESVTELPRWAIHDGDTVWLVDDDNRLNFHKVSVARFFNDKALISPGLPQGARVVITNLKLVTDGMSVRVADQNKSVQPQKTEIDPATKTATGGKASKE